MTVSKIGFAATVSKDLLCWGGQRHACNISCNISPCTKADWQALFFPLEHYGSDCVGSQENQETGTLFRHAQYAEF